MSAHHALAPLTSNQIAVLEWFSTRDWTPHREWIREMTTTTPRSLLKRGLLEVDYTRTTTHYRISDAGRAVIAKAASPSMFDGDNALLMNDRDAKAMRGAP